MADLISQFEIVDNAGNTQSFVGTVGTTPILIPGSIGNNINALLVHCPTQSPVSRLLFFSFDGTNYHQLATGESVSWSTKGSKKQIYVKASTANVSYEVIINFDQAGEL